MSLETYTEVIRERIGDDNGVIEKTFKIFLKDMDKVIYIDGKSKPNTVHNDDFKADMTVILSEANFKKLLSKEVAGPILMMTGKLKIKGDVRIAIKMDDILKMNELPPAKF